MSDQFRLHSQLRGATLVEQADSPPNSTDPLVAQPVGTRFIAFGENATSEAQNRAVGAVQENADWLGRSVLSEVAVPYLLDATQLIDAGNVVCLHPAAWAQLRVYVNAGGNTTAHYHEIIRVLDQNLDEITHPGTGVRCGIVASKLCAGQGMLNTVGAGEIIPVQPTVNIVSMTRHSLTCAGSFLAGAPEDETLRIVCPGDQVVIAGNHVDNDTNPGTLDWEVHKIEFQTIEVRCRQDPSRALTLVAPISGTVTIQSNGNFFTNPHCQLNFNPLIACPTVSAIYVACAVSEQVLSTDGTLAAMQFPLSPGSLVKMWAGAAAGGSSRFAQLRQDLDTLEENTYTLDAAYDQRQLGTTTDTPGGGRTITADAGSVRIQSAAGTVDNDFKAALEVGTFGADQVQLVLCEQVPANESAGFAGLLELKNCEENYLRGDLEATLVNKQNWITPTLGVGETIDSLLSEATLVHVTTGTYAGYYVMTTKNNSATMRVQNLDGTLTQFDGSTATIRLYEITAHTGYRAEKRSLQVASADMDTSSSAIRTLKMISSVALDADDITHIISRSQILGAFGLVTVFRVSGSGNVELAGKLQDSGGKNYVHMVDVDGVHLHTSKAGDTSLWLKNDGSGLLVEGSVEAKVEMRGPGASAEEGVSTTLWDLVAAPEAPIVLLHWMAGTVVTSNEVGVFTPGEKVTWNNGTSSAICIRSSAGSLTLAGMTTDPDAGDSFEGVDSGATADCDSSPVPETVQALSLDHTTTQHEASLRLSWPLTQWGDSPNDGDKICLRFGAANSTQVLARRGTDGYISPITDVFGIATAAQFLQLGHGEGAAVGARCGFTYDNAGNLYLGSGFVRFLRYRKIGADAGSEYDFWSAAEALSDGTKEAFTATQVGLGGVCGTTGAEPLARNVPSWFTTSTVDEPTTGAVVGVFPADDYQLRTSSASTVEDGCVPIGVLEHDISDTMSGYITVVVNVTSGEFIPGETITWNAGTSSATYVREINNHAGMMLANHTSDPDNADVFLGTVSAAEADCNSSPTTVTAHTHKCVKYTGFAQVQKLAGSAITRGQTCYLSENGVVVHEADLAYPIWRIGTALRSAGAAEGFVDLALSISPVTP